MFRIKSQRAEQITKRMTKDDRLTKQQKDQLKEKVVNERDLYE
jgi:hypothetical protein